MTADIIPFPSRDAPIRSKDYQETRAVQEAAKRRVVRELRDALARPTGRSKFPRKLPRDEDAIRLAQRLGDDLERIKKSGRGDLSTILKNAGQTLTTRARYALFSNEPPRGKRVRKLQPYVRLSDAIADFRRMDKELYLYNNLDGLSVLKSDQSIDDAAADLRRFIELMAEDVAKKTKIVEFFDRAATTLGDMDENGRILLSNTSVLRYRPYDGWPDYPEDPRQPIPLVPIFRMREQMLHGRARIAPWVEGRPQNFSDLFRAADDESADVTDIVVEIWREFSLTICECGEPGVIKPMFAGRPQVQVVIGDIVAHHPRYPWTAEPFYSPFEKDPVLLADGHRWTACRPNVEVGDAFSDYWIEPAMPPDEPAGASRYYFEHYYFSTHPVNVWNVRRLLDVCGNIGHVESLLPDVKEGVGLIYRLPSAIGQRFEAALHTGWLEAALSDAIERLKSELARYSAERQMALDEQDEVALARWRPTEATDEATDIEKPEE